MPSLGPPLWVSPPGTVGYTGTVDSDLPHHVMPDYGLLALMTDHTNHDATDKSERLFSIVRVKPGITILKGAEEAEQLLLAGVMSALFNLDIPLYFAHCWPICGVGH